MAVVGNKQTRGLHEYKVSSCLVLQEPNESEGTRTMVTELNYSDDDDAGSNVFCDFNAAGSRGGGGDSRGLAMGRDSRVIVTDSRNIAKRASSNLSTLHSLEISKSVAWAGLSFPVVHNVFFWNKLESDSFYFYFYWRSESKQSVIIHQIHTQKISTWSSNLTVTLAFLILYSI